MERSFDFKRQNYNLYGQQYYIVGGIPTSNNPKQSIYLFDCLGKEPDSSLRDKTADLSLWRVEFCDEEDMHLWPYEGEDREYLIRYLAERLPLGAKRY